MGCFSAFLICGIEFVNLEKKNLNSDGCHIEKSEICKWFSLDPVKTRNLFEKSNMDQTYLTDGASY